VALNVNSTKWKHFDLRLMGLAFAATIIGLIFIYDAGYARAMQGGGVRIPVEFRSQLMFLIPAIGISIYAGTISPRTWFKSSKLIWCASLLLLIAVEVIGVTRNGAKRWLDLGPIEIQPAEFVKITAVLYMAASLAVRSEWKSKGRNFAEKLDYDLIPKLKRCLPAVWLMLAVLIIEKEPDMGTGAVVAATSFAMFFPAGVTRKSLIVAACIAALGAGLMVMKEPYRLERLTNHWHRWDAKNLDDISYQTVQSEASMASGGIFGVGLGAGRAKHVMPATTTDFIMATVGEETGLVGTLIVLGVLGALVWRLGQLAQSATSRYRMLVLYGVAAWIGIQSSVNVMMANGALPAIGIPVPFISSGGSSLVALWLAIGICQSMLLPEPAKEESDEIGRNRRGHRRPRLSSAGRSRKPVGARRGSDVPRIAAGPRS
jgi:cell division protein FtsW